LEGGWLGGAEQEPRGAGCARDVRSVEPGEDVDELLVWKSLHGPVLLYSARILARLVGTDGEKSELGGLTIVA
jgi:hypothetical protein